MAGKLPFLNVAGATLRDVALAVNNLIRYANTTASGFSVDGAIAVFDGTSGNAIENSNVTLGTVATGASITLADGTALSASGTASVTGTNTGDVTLTGDSYLTLSGQALTAHDIVESQISLSDVTTDDVTSTKHGFAPKAPADATKFLNGAATPAFAQVKDSDLSTSDITTNNVTTSKHGFAPKAPNDSTQFLDGTGSWSVPSGTGTGAAWSITHTTISSPVANIDYTGLSGKTDAIVIMDNVTKSGSDTSRVNVSTDNGSTWDTTSGNYLQIAAAGTVSNLAGFPLHGTATNLARYGVVEIRGLSVTGPKVASGQTNSLAFLYVGSTSAITALRVTNVAAANFTGGDIYLLTR